MDSCLSYCMQEPEVPFLHLIKKVPGGARRYSLVIRDDQAQTGGNEARRQTRIANLRETPPRRHVPPRAPSVDNRGGRASRLR